MWFGLPAEVAVRCGHCGENDWRTPVELKSGRLVCFMCGQISLVPPADPVQAEDRPPAAAAAETVRRLVIHQPPPRPAVAGAGAAVPEAEPPDAAGSPPFGLSLVPNGR